MLGLLRWRGEEAQAGGGSCLCLPVSPLPFQEAPSLPPSPFPTSSSPSLPVPGHYFGGGAGWGRGLRGSAMPGWEGWNSLLPLPGDGWVGGWLVRWFLPSPPVSLWIPDGGGGFQSGDGEGRKVTGRLEQDWPDRRRDVNSNQSSSISLSHLRLFHSKSFIQNLIHPLLRSISPNPILLLSSPPPLNLPNIGKPFDIHSDITIPIFIIQWTIIGSSHSDHVLTDQCPHPPSIHSICLHTCTHYMGWLPFAGPWIRPCLPGSETSLSPHALALLQPSRSNFL